MTDKPVSPATARAFIALELAGLALMIPPAIHLRNAGAMPAEVNNFCIFWAIATALISALLLLAKHEGHIFGLRLRRGPMEHFSYNVAGLLPAFMLLGIFGAATQAYAVYVGG